MAGRFHKRASLALFCLLLAACSAAPVAPDTRAQQSLAPGGTLRVGLYPGTPTSILQDPVSHQTRGVGYDLGAEFARRLGVPFEPVVFAKNAEVLEAVKTGKVDLAFTNASAARAREMDFTRPYLEIELGYLVGPRSSVSTLAAIDRAGIRVGVTEHSSSDTVLSRDLRNAAVVRASTVKAGIAMLSAGEIDAYATNKATLFEMAESLPGAKVLAGRWGVERHAIAMPKGRDQGMPFARRFVDQVTSDGVVQGAIARAGLRGVVPPESK